MKVKIAGQEALRIDEMYFRVPMRQLRGVITSLQNKGIVGTDHWTDNNKDLVWVCILEKHSEGWKEEYNRANEPCCPFTDGIFGFKIINVELEDE